MSRELLVVSDKELWLEQLTNFVVDADPEGKLLRLRCFASEEWAKKMAGDQELPYKKVLFMGALGKEKFRSSVVVYDKCGVKIAVGGNHCGIFSYKEQLNKDDIDVLCQNGEISKSVAEIAKKRVAVVQAMTGCANFTGTLIPDSSWPWELVVLFNDFKKKAVADKLGDAAYHLAIKKFCTLKLLDFMGIDAQEWEAAGKKDDPKYKPID